jgi:hypothetical protein
MTCVLLAIAQTEISHQVMSATAAAVLLWLYLQVAWVTRAGTSEMDKPIAIRPTSETVSSCSAAAEQ